MKASLHVISDAVALSLTSVRRSNGPFVVGGFVALDGAWDRKKIVVALGRDPDHGQYALLQNVGRIFSDGRWVKPTRASKPVRCYLHSGGSIQWPGSNKYVPVVPGKKPAKKLRPTKIYDGRVRRQALRNYDRIQFLRTEIAATELVLEGLRKELRQFAPF